MGSFQDNAMAPSATPQRPFTKETGIKVNYKLNDSNSLVQNAKNDGLNKTGAYDIYVMDDNWVPEFAAGKIIQSLDALGFKKRTRTSWPRASTAPLWPPRRSTARR